MHMLSAGAHIRCSTTHLSFHSGSKGCNHVGDLHVHSRALQHIACTRLNSSTQVQFDSNAVKQLRLYSNNRLKAIMAHVLLISVGSRILNFMQSASQVICLQSPQVQSMALLQKGMISTSS